MRISVRRICSEVIQNKNCELAEGIESHPRWAVPYQGSLELKVEWNGFLPTPNALLPSGAEVPVLLSLWLWNMV